MRTKRALLICGAVVSALVAGGCGSEPFPQAQTHVSPTTVRGKAAAAAASPRARLLAAAQRVAQEKTAKLAMQASLTGLPADEDASFTGTGAVDLANRRLEMTLDVDAAGDTQHVEVRVVDGTAYANTGDGWTSMPVSEATPTDLPDVQTYLQYLQGVSNDVRADGREVVRGAQTTRYVATVDLARLSANSKSSAPLQQALVMFGNVKIPFTVWVDDAGRVRKLQMSFELGKLLEGLGMPAGASPKMEMTFELYDFGAPVDVQAPAGAKSAAVADQDRAAQSDLRNALTAEKTYYTDSVTYTTDLAQLRMIEPSLDWGGKLKVVAAGGGSAVCVSEASASGATFALYDSPVAGTYYGSGACPAVVGATAPTGFSLTGW